MPARKHGFEAVICGRVDSAGQLCFVVILILRVNAAPYPVNLPRANIIIDAGDHGFLIRIAPQQGNVFKGKDGSRTPQDGGYGFFCVYHGLNNINFMIFGSHYTNLDFEMQESFPTAANE